VETDRSTVGGPDPTVGRSDATAGGPDPEVGPEPVGGSPAGSSDDDARVPQRRRAVIVPLVVVAVLVLVVAIGGSILAYRALSPDPGADKSAIIEGSEILETTGGTMPGPRTVAPDPLTVTGS